MCYSYSIHHQSTALPFDASQIQIPSPGFYFSGFQKPHLPICTSSEKWELAQWGLIPSWVDPENRDQWASRTLNARSETAWEKPAFKNAWEKHPCIILSTGFFEWQHLGKTKQPYFIYPQSKGYLWLAGLYEDLMINGLWLRTYSILTTESNGIMSEIHNLKHRMPVILNENELSQWLHDSIQVRSELCKDRKTDFLKAHKIHPNFNKNLENINSIKSIEPYINLQSELDF